MFISSKKFLYRLSLVVVGALLCLPVLLVKYPPLVDYPNHLARAYILFHYDDLPIHQLRYIKQFSPIPNLAIDLILLFLQSFVGILAAGKIFLIVTVIIFVVGCHLLGKAAQGRATWLALPCCFFVYNSAFLYGFVNYVLGVGLFCIALAGWFEWRARWTGKTLLLSSALVFGAYLAHLSAYTFLGLSFVIVELWSFRARTKPLGQAVLSLIPLLPSLLAFIAFMHGSGEVGRLEWNTITGKLIGTLGLLLSYNYKLDVLLVAGTLIVLVILAMKAKVISVAWPLFIVGVVFALFYLLSPKVIFTASGADARFVVPAVLLLVLSLKLETQQHTGKVLLIVYLLLATVRIGAIGQAWITLDRRTAAEVARLTALPEGSAIYPMFMAPGNREQNKLERSFEHTVHYATIYRRAFVPTLFAYRGQQPLVFRSAPRYFAPWSDKDTEGMLDLSDYDFVWSYGINAEVKDALVRRCILISEADGFALWKINR